MTIRNLPGLPPSNQQFVDGNGFLLTPWREYLQQLDNRVRRLLGEHTAVAVASLPAASAMGRGARAFVNNANSTTFGATVAGGGSNVVPVYSDGTNWKIG